MKHTDNIANLELENLTIQTAPEITKQILESTQKGLGFIPNMYAQMGHNPALLDSYFYSYNSFRTLSGFTPVEQEVIFLSVAYENNCEYCVAAHSFIADKMSKVPEDITEAIRQGSEISDAKLAALSTLSRSLTRNRGIVSQEEVNDFLSVGYTKNHVLGVIAGIAVKTMSNYSNHITHPELDEAFEGRVWKK